SFMFFQAAERIRDRNVTGVQTCALPISGIGEQLSEPDEGITVLQAGTTSWSEGIDGSPGALTAAFGRVAPDVSHVLLRTAEEQEIGRASCREIEGLKERWQCHE